MQSFEKLGAFYLGRMYDQGSGRTTEDLLLYDAKDLTTHAVCVGMTGSGKTGLCVSLVEEAAIDSIPVIVIDPKGDLGNLMLTFPELRPDDFRSWIDEGQAARQGLAPEQYAAKVAEQWRKGLAEWGQDGSRIARFRNAADVKIYTPGSTAGLPLQVLRSFAPPPAALLDDRDAVRERLTAGVSGLLALLGLDADPIRSREHILLSNLVQRAWDEGREPDLQSLIREIQTPPIERVGVIDLESFFPARERFEFAMGLNSLLASPGFAGWMEGEPLSIPGLLWTPEGKPRVSILSIHHLTDEERMFFVTLLLNEVVAWMRTQPGTTSLRALLYMDEVFGFFPPTANPPSKLPMLTLLKQARAYGLGVVLATQNPVDLDYKGLSNAGTWFLGRLQTERDKQRVLEGLEGASTISGASFDRQQLEATLAGLPSRVFLMNNVHDDQPALFHTRWALSYLRGPLTKPQIRSLTGERVTTATTAPPCVAAEPRPRPAAPSAAAPSVVTGPVAGAGQRPVLPADVAEYHMTPSVGLTTGDRLLYRPALIGDAQLHFVRARQGLDEWEEVFAMVPLAGTATTSIWNDGEILSQGMPALSRTRSLAGDYSELPVAAMRARSYAKWGKNLSSWLYRTRSMSLWKCGALKTTSRPDETEGEFRIRLSQLVREKRDRDVAKLEKRYTPKLARLNDRIRKAADRISREKSQYGQQKLQTAISVGATMLGALFGRKVASVGTVGRATTAVRGVGRAAREKGDVARATQELEIQQQKLQELEREFEEELAAIRDAADPTALDVEKIDVRPRKSDITVGQVRLVWTPWRVGPDGIAEPLA
jgi:hypothetical protein